MILIQSQSIQTLIHCFNMDKLHKSHKTITELLGMCPSEHLHALNTHTDYLYLLRLKAKMLLGHINIEYTWESQPVKCVPLLRCIAITNLPNNLLSLG